MTSKLAQRTAAVIAAVSFALAIPLGAFADMSANVSAGVGVSAEANSSNGITAAEHSAVRANAAASTTSEHPVAASVRALVTKLQAARGDFQTRIKEMRDKLLNAKQEIKVKLNDRAKANVAAVLGAIITRFKNVETKLDNVSARLAANITDIENKKNIDLSESTSLLADADAKLALAKGDVADAEADINAELNATTSKETLKADVETAKSSLKDAQDAYLAVIKSIRTEVQAKVKATTTASADASL
jgi:hypothetical protein